jgi:hopene-associated glycosyltransferase HpnB
MSGEMVLLISVLSLAIWVVLLAFRGEFWGTDQQLAEQTTDLATYPAVCVIIPARNEADLLPLTLKSLLTQDYPGSFKVILVDDGSTDGTSSAAVRVAQELNKTQLLYVKAGEALPQGWTGKLWALHQGIQYAHTITPLPDYFLLTDADIEHDATNLWRLVAKAQQEDLDLVSLMVKLRCESFWEKLLIPAFIFFFQKLYPFRWVNNPSKQTAAAAGGCILITREALTAIGGIQIVRSALIDDCALATVVKSQCRNRIWLGLTNLTCSLRPYSSLSTIWDMVARSAFTQLNYSKWLLLVTTIGMILVYMVPPVSVVLGAVTGNWVVASVGLSTWLLMAYAYLPTIHFYKLSPWFAFYLPLIALLYTLMTLDSAWRHWQKRGGTWKGRVYSETIG